MLNLHRIIELDEQCKIEIYLKSKKLTQQNKQNMTEWYKFVNGMNVYPS